MISGKGPACAPCRSIRYTRDREDVRATVLAVVTLASAVVEDTGPGRCVPDMRVHGFFVDLDCFVYFPSFPEQKCRRQNACSWIHAAVIHLAVLIYREKFETFVRPTTFLRTASQKSASVKQC